jgi:hypothetical protein
MCIYLASKLYCLLFALFLAMLYLEYGNLSILSWLWADDLDSTTVQWFCFMTLLMAHNYTVQSQLQLIAVGLLDFSQLHFY